MVKYMIQIHHYIINYVHYYDKKIEKCGENIPVYLDNKNIEDVKYNVKVNKNMYLLEKHVKMVNQRETIGLQSLTNCIRRGIRTRALQ